MGGETNFCWPVDRGIFGLINLTDNCLFILVSQINNLSRDTVESELTFAGFIVFSCPLKEDAIEALKELNESSHRCIMITGDNPLTACAVAREVAIVEREVLIVDKLEEKTVFHSVDESIRFEVDPNVPLDQKMLDKYDLCITGSAMSDFMDKPNMKILLEHTWVYARVSPSQKVKYNNNINNS